jgi:AcrR family transcriptional regulator
MTAQQVRTVDGRIAGKRGQATRARLLECLGEMLVSQPYRSITVIDVARLAGTSPATFYQYFPDIESAIIEIANDMAKDGAHLKELADGRTWSGRAGMQAAEALVDGFLEFWNEHEAILRVVDLATAEGDKRFHKIRMKILNNVTTSLADAISGLQAAGKADAVMPPTATAGALVAMLASISAHQRVFEAWSIKLAELRTAMIGLVFMGITQKKPVAV